MEDTHTGPNHHFRTEQIPLAYLKKDLDLISWHWDLAEFLVYNPRKMKELRLRASDKV